ncbi:MAG: hypothetical protein V4694_05480 [Pseudomonadota bacterium]
MKFDAAYNLEDKKILIINSFDGKYLAAVLVHECSHAQDYMKGIIYDKGLLMKCFNNIMDNSLFAKGHYFLGSDAYDPKNLLEHISIDHKVIRKLSDCGIENGERKSADALETIFSGNTATFFANGKSFTSKLEHSNTGCTKDLMYITDLESGIITEATQEQKIASNFLEGLVYVDGFFNHYLNKKDMLPIQITGELNAGIVCHIPEKIIDHFCPEGFGEKVGVKEFYAQVKVETCQLDKFKTSEYCKPSVSVEKPVSESNKGRGGRVS